MKVYRREGVARVRDQHTCFSDGTIADGDTLYEPRSAHLRRKFQKKERFFPLLLAQIHSQESRNDLFANSRKPFKIRTRKLEQSAKFKIAMKRCSTRERESNGRRMGKYILLFLFLCFWAVDFEMSFYRQLMPANGTPNHTLPFTLTSPTLFFFSKRIFLHFISNLNDKLFAVNEFYFSI